MEQQSHPQDHAAQGNGSAAHHPQYHAHNNPQFYGSGHTQDTLPLTPEQNAERLANYQHEHASQLAQNLESHGGHPGQQDGQKSRSGRSTPKLHYHPHNNPQFYGGHAPDARPLTPEQNAENLARYQQEHANQLAQNLASHGGHASHHDGQKTNSGRSTPKLNYHPHNNPQFYGGHAPDGPALTSEQNAANLAKYQQEHAAQLAQNLASHGGHPGQHEGQKTNSGRSTPKLHYHQHKNPQYFGGGHVHDGPALTPEQNAANLAKYNREHAILLEQNLVSHGGHVEGDEYVPSRGAHHHPHFTFLTHKAH